MSQTVDAVFEHGLLRPIEPLAFKEGARVTITLNGNGAPALDREPVEKTHEEIVAAMDEVAAASVNHDDNYDDGPKPVSEHHDYYLYGEGRRK